MSLKQFSKTVEINGMRTHYLEAGSPHQDTIVLLHSGEFGASAELSWEFTIEELGNEFHVLAPDMLGYGKSEKVFNFEHKIQFRIDHLTNFFKTLCLDQPHFIGNSMGGSIIAKVAARPSPDWSMDKIILVSGAGRPLNNDAREVLQSYDGSKEHMEQVLSVLFATDWWDEEYLERKMQESRRRGAWECTAAPRFKPPYEVERPRFTEYTDLDYSTIDQPTLIVAGDDDPLREPNYGTTLREVIPDARLETIPNASHCPQIEHSTKFNRIAMDFLSS